MALRFTNVLMNHNLSEMLSLPVLCIKHEDVMGVGQYVNIWLRAKFLHFDRHLWICGTMKQLIVQCLVIASVAVAWPATRQRRDTAYLKRIFSGSQLATEPPMFDKTEVRAYPIPGFQHIMVKSEPKSSITEEIIFPGQVMEVMPINFQYDAQQKKTETKNISFKTKEKIDLANSKYVEIEKDKQDTKTNRPVYSKIHSTTHDKEKGFSFPDREPVVVWTGNLGIPTYDNTKSAFPMCIKKRIDDIIMLGTNPKVVFPKHETPFSPPVVMDQLYSLNANPLVYHLFLPIFREDVGNFGPLGFESSHYVPVHRFIEHSSSHNFGATHHHSQSNFFHTSKTNVHKNYYNDVKISPNSVIPDNIDVSQTLGPMPPQFLPEHGQVVTKVTKNNVATGGNLFGQHENVAQEENIPHFAHKYVYQDIEGGKLETVQQKDTVKTNLNNKMQQNYYYVPPVIKNVIEHNVSTKSEKVDISKTASVSKESVNSTTVMAHKDALSTKNETQTLKDHPIVVTDNYNHSFKYQQTNVDGTSINFKGDKTGVDIEVNTHRGDISDTDE